MFMNWFYTKLNIQTSFPSAKHILLSDVGKLEIVERRNYND